MTARNIRRARGNMNRKELIKAVKEADSVHGWVQWKNRNGAYIKMLKYSVLHALENEEDDGSIYNVKWEFHKNLYIDVD